MGATHLGARALGRFDLRWLMLGAILPDAIPRVAGMAVAVIPTLSSFATLRFSVCAAMMHTPFSVALLVGALMILAANRTAARNGLIVGAAWHFALDALQKSFGCGSMLLYPLGLKPYTLNVAWYENPVTYALLVGFAIYLAALWWRRRPFARDWPFRRFTAKRLLAVAGLLAVYFGLPVLTVDRAVAEAVENSQFALDPEKFAGEKVTICVAQVTAVADDRFSVEFDDTEYEVLWPGEPAVSDSVYVSVAGTYSGGVVDSDIVFVHSYRLKSAVSLLGALLLVLLWGPSLISARSTAWRSLT